MSNDRERFLQIMADADKWLAIDEIVSRLDSGGFWDCDSSVALMTRAKKAEARKLIKSLKDGDHSEYASVETQNEKGETVRLYKQELLFDVSDYQQVVSYHADRSEYHHKMAAGYAARCQQRFDTQLDIDF